MSVTYHLLDPKGELLSSADTIEYLRGLVADLPPGSYAVDEIRDAPPRAARPARDGARSAGLRTERPYWNPIRGNPDPVPRPASAPRADASPHSEPSTLPVNGA